MKFEWDANKNRLNIEKHGLSFDDAESVFEGPMIVSLDTRQEYSETRWLAMGYSHGRIIVLVYTERDQGETIRIISMRKAHKHERKRFEETLSRWQRLGPG